MLTGSFLKWIEMNDYAQFVATKLSTVPPTGIAEGFSLPGSLFPHQSALTAWALRRGRAAIFADTGLGKSRMQLSWAAAVHRYTKRPVLILAPLAVAAQTVTEGAVLGVEVQHCRDGAEVGPGINITNYDRLHRFDPAVFGSVVLDESSCIKHHNSKTLQTLLDAFKSTQFKLCATATPAPNDWVELGTHAEFLGICTRQEMLAEYFTHDGGDTSSWRLKGHARHVFWRWVSSWGAMIRKPSDLGFDDGAYNLPALHLHEHSVDFEMPLNGMLFAAEAQSLSERREARLRDELLDQLDRAVVDLAIYGEWCGGSIQKGIALSGLPKMFVIFAVKADDTWIDLEHLSIPIDVAAGVRCITESHSYLLEIDFARPELAQSRLVELTTAVEAACPFGALLGVTGVGEGIVWQRLDDPSSDYWFKVKGEKHSASKVKTLAAVDVEKVTALREFVESVVTEARCEQGLQNLTREQLKPFEMASMGDFIRWVHGDVMKEEGDTIAANGIDPKKMGGMIAPVARAWFVSRLDAAVMNPEGVEA